MKKEAVNLCFSLSYFSYMLKSDYHTDNSMIIRLQHIPKIMACETFFIVKTMTNRIKKKKYLMNIYRCGANIVRFG